MAVTFVKLTHVSQRRTKTAYSNWTELFSKQLVVYLVFVVCGLFAQSQKWREIPTTFFAEKRIFPKLHYVRRSPRPADRLRSYKASTWWITFFSHSQETAAKKVGGLGHARQSRQWLIRSDVWTSGQVVSKSPVTHSLAPPLCAPEMAFLCIYFYDSLTDCMLPACLPASVQLVTFVRRTNQAAKDESQFDYVAKGGFNRLVYRVTEGRNIYRTINIRF